MTYKEPTPKVYTTRYYYDQSTGHRYMPVVEYESGYRLCRCYEDGFYYMLDYTDLDRMCPDYITTDGSDVMAALADKEQGRLGHLTRERGVDIDYGMCDD